MLDNELSANLKHYSHTIFKGCHFSTFVPCLQKMRDDVYFSVSRTLQFDECHLYDIAEKSCVNKLFGYSFGLFGVHKNSARFGWACDDGKIVVYVYFYKDGKLNKKSVATFGVGTTHEYSMTMYYDKDDNKHYVEWFVDGQKVQGCFFKARFGWLLSLGFYFGGNSVAPHTMKLSYDETITKYRR